MTDVTHLIDLRQKYDALLQQVNSLQLQAGIIWTELKSACTHPTTVKKSHHYPGGYFDTAETHRWDECTICNQKSNLKVQRGGYG